MNAPLSPSKLRQMGEANELRPVSLREDPAWFAPDPANADAFIAAEAASLAEKMQARLVRDAPDQYGVAQAFSCSANAALYRLMVLAAQDKPAELIQAVKQLAKAAIDDRADHLATVKWQRIDI